MFKQVRIAIILLVIAAFSIFLSACGSTSTDTGAGSAGKTPAATSATTSGGPNCVAGTLQIDGSSALQPLVSAVADDYQKKCSGSKITVVANGSGTGLKDVNAGSVGIGNSDVFPKDAEQKKNLVDHQVAVVIFALIVNQKVTGVKSLTPDQINKIYTGAVTNWKELGGPDLKIVVVERPSGSGTRATFDKYVLNGGKETVQGDQKLQTDVTGTVISNVQNNDGAIGYVTLGAAKGNSNVTIIGIDGKTPSKESVADGSYKFWNIEHMYTKGEATGLAKALIDYMSSDAAKTQAETLGYVLLSDVPKTLLDPRQA